MNIAVIGTGLMGAPMAINLVRAGHHVRIWNRSAQKMDPVVAAGASAEKTAADAVAGADVVISMLSDGPATAAVLDDPDLLARLQVGAVWIEMASVRPNEARAQAQRLGNYGVGHLDAPVSGGTKGANAGTLAIMVGGDIGVFRKVSVIFEPLGRAVLVGPSGTGQLAKLANQAIVAITIGAVAEATLLVEAGGADPSAVRDALAGGFADSPILQLHGARMERRDFAPGGLSRLQLKDLDNALAEAQHAKLTLPMTENVRDRFVRLCTELGGADLDHSALFVELMDQNGRTGDRT